MATIYEHTGGVPRYFFDEATGMVYDHARGQALSYPRK